VKWEIKMPDDFDTALQDALDATAASLNGPYKQALRTLLALSMNDIKSTVPTASYADYSKLLSVIEHASARNVAQAELVEKIKVLGTRAVSIAKLVPSLAAIF
jgi:hypothetical protein